MENGRKCLCCDSEDYLETCNGNVICKQCLREQESQVELYEDNKTTTYPEMDEVIKGRLMLGNYDYAKDKYAMKGVGITHILVIGSELKCLFKNDFIYLQLPIQDYIEQSVIEYFDNAIDFIMKSTICFVHCNAGVSRSPTFVIAFLMSYKKLSFQKAYDYLKTIRKSIHPNNTFISELKEYEKRVSYNKSNT